jgi:energy-coupling factor transporter ATP-binding protein EcfA2
VAEIRARIMAARNAGAAVLLMSEDLDEVMELSDRILVMSEGRIAYETPAATASLAEIGRHMAGTPDGPDRPPCPSPSTSTRPRTALIVIDMQRDFIEHGGFGEASATTCGRCRPSCRRWRRLIDGAARRACR